MGETMAGAGSWRALGLGRKTQAAALRGSQAINRAALPELLAGTSLESWSPSASGVPPCPGHNGRESGTPEMIPRGAGPLGALPHLPVARRFLHPQWEC